MYRDDEANRFLEVTYQNGDKEILYYKDFASGRDDREHRAPGQEAGDQAGHRRRRARRVHAGPARQHQQEYKEHEDLPNTTNPDDWAKISGKKGERIVFIRTLVNEGKAAEDVSGGRAIERVATGQYL